MKVGFGFVCVFVCVCVMKMFHWTTLNLLERVAKGEKKCEFSQRRLTHSITCKNEWHVLNTHASVCVCVPVRVLQWRKRVKADSMQYKWTFQVFLLIIWL